MNKKIYLFIAIISLACLALESAGEPWTPPPLTWGADAQKVLDQLMIFICWPACLIIYASSGIAALLLIFSGARYIAADDPGTRAELRRFMIGIMVGFVLVLIAVPIINYIIDSLLPPVTCECIPASEVDNINTIFCSLISALSTIGPWICALMVVYGGLRYLSSADDPGLRKAAKTTIIGAFVGMVIIMLAIPIVNLVLGDALDRVECEITQGEISKQISAVLSNFLCIFVLISPPICALVVTYGGLRYITSADDPGARDTAKTIIISALIGMILVMIAIPVVNSVLTIAFGQVKFNDSCLQGPAVGEITRIMCNFWCFLSYIAPAVCVLVVIYGGLRYLVSGDDPGARRTARTIIISAFVGMILVFISIPVVNLVLTDVFKQVGCDCPEMESVKEIVRILCKLICFIASIAPAIAAVVIMYGGLRYITSAEDPGARSSAKTIIISAIVGLILVMISLAMVNMVISGWATDVQCGCFTIEDPAKQISQIFCTLACTLQLITPSVAALVMMYGGLKYVTSGEDPSARAGARGIVIHAFIGLVIVLVAIQIVNVVIAGLIPTFKCDCAQVFGTLGSQNPADPQLHILGVPGTEDKCDHNGEIGGKCCKVGDTECHFVYLSGGNMQRGDSTGKIIGCTPPAGSNGYYTLTLEGGGTTMTPQADAKCADSAGNPSCSSITEAASWGPTYVFDAANGKCINKCASGQNCCQTTDQNGRPGCIGADSGNIVKTFTCSADVKSTYVCVSDKCTLKEVMCDQICKDGYSCAEDGLVPDPGELDLANPEIN
jgi:hypothetical protein